MYYLCITHATFQLRGYCTPAGYDRLDTVLRNLCTLYNAALFERIDAYRKTGKSPTAYDQHKSLTQIRRDDAFFGSLHVGIGRGPINQLDRAFNAFFRRLRNGEKPGFPRFRAESRFQCIDVLLPKPRMVKRLKNRKWVVKVKGLPTIYLRSHRNLPAEGIKSLRIVRRATGVTVDLVYTVEKQPLASCEKVVGIDMGVRKRMTLSTGETIPPVVRDDEAIGRQHQRISRMKKGSRNRKLRGQTWGLLQQQLAYKAEWAGREFVKVPAAYTSQECHRCGARNNPGTSETYRCRSCDLEMDRDVNAALNIMRAGTFALAEKQKGVSEYDSDT